ncbi:glutaminase A [Streptomyces niveiscabiei]|uniref:glutaminase A n=1 Tax=Streptomyces niveiscabiei TaxID=164115 RepID=UPI0029A29A1E|nr:glutaminase A [Streptomyces niveiscabiei]MDX3386051.1 glutaminase A [Streptomyces niveiscabiei]
MSRTTPHDPEASTAESALRALFDAFDDDGNGTLSYGELTDRMRAAGILDDDPRVMDLLSATDDRTHELGFEEFATLVRRTSGLIRRVVQDDLAVPGFAGLAADIDVLHKELTAERGGAVADYIPQLAQVDPELFAIAVCSVDGQRHLAGDAREPFCIQSVSKTVNYCLALDENGLGETHTHVGREPSGLSFNELTLNPQGRPHNPMINAGAIMSASLIRPQADAAGRFEHVARTWQRLAAGRRTGFSNSTYLSERDTADRNFALAYSMREHEAFPEGTDLQKTLEFYFQCCSIELDADMLATVAATFANGGVCPLTGDRVFSADTVRHCLSLMTSCGMYDYSGEFAFSIGLPAKSGVSGALMIVVPQVMGVCVWSPRLDQHGNSVRGVEFCRRLVERYNVHPHDAAEGQSGRKDLRRGKNRTAMETVTALCWAAGQGDLDEIRRLTAEGADLDAADYDGRTALHLAAGEGRTEVVEYLLAHGVRPEPRDRWGGTPLTDAERAGHPDIVQLLRVNGQQPRTAAARPSPRTRSRVPSRPRGAAVRDGAKTPASTAGVR